MGGAVKATRPERWVALLRGINVGGRTRVAMADLRLLFSDLGAEHVSTYVQSGNVVFRSARARGGLDRLLEDEIRGRLGLDLTVVLRSGAELARLVAASPFAREVPDTTKLHVTFLAEPPDRARAGALEAARFEPDRFHLTPGAVYLHCPEGYGRSKLSNAFFEQQLGVRATTRNWRTVMTLAELAQG
jgi:uncharacterized protein (DUF1697 family)